MRLYKVHMEGDFGEHDSMAQWTPRKSDVPALKALLRERLHGEAETHPRVTAVEFLPTVDGILKVLNQHADKA